MVKTRDDGSHFAGFTNGAASKNLICMTHA